MIEVTPWLPRSMVEGVVGDRVMLDRSFLRVGKKESGQLTGNLSRYRSGLAQHTQLQAQG